MGRFEPTAEVPGDGVVEAELRRVPHVQMRERLPGREITMA
ncbi:hypothetical protein [Streptomyces sp. RK9]